MLRFHSLLIPLNQRGIAPLVIILILAVTIIGGATVYRSSNQFNIKEDKTSEKIGGRLQNKAPEASKVNLANSNKLAEKPVTLPVEQKKDGEEKEEKAVPRFSITPPAGWDTLPPNGNIVLEFLSPAKDTLEEGMAYIDIQPNITVFVAKGDYENLDAANAAYASKSSEDTSREKTTINGQEAIVTRSTKDLADLLKDTLLTNIKQEVAKSGTKISEAALKKDVEALLKEAKAEILSYSFYKDGYYINVSGKALKSFWNKREVQLKQSMDTFKIVDIITKSSNFSDVLGVPCKSGSLSTSTNKVYQMMYPNETFLQLTNIDLLKDVSQLQGLTCLQYLDATDRAVKGDIAGLKDLVDLEVFSLYSNPEVSGDICSLSNATKLRSLKFAFDPKITGDISCLKNLSKLETFAMTHTQISGDISVFANMPNLKAIYISGTNVKGDICSLKDLTNLEELGIADEYPGNPDITGDLSCLDNLQKLKRVSIYNTKTNNCEAFTKSHPNLARTKTESGKQGGGGCSKESMKTLVDYAQKYEKRIGKEVQTQVKGKPNYRPGSSNEDPQGSGEQPNIFQKFVMWVFGLFGKTPPQGSGDEGSGRPGASNEVPGQQEREEKEALLKQGKGPGGCKSQAECQAYCSNTDHREECDKFGPPGGER